MPNITIKTDEQKSKTILILNEMINHLKRDRQNKIDEIITPWIGEEISVGWRKTKTLLTDRDVENHLRHYDTRLWLKIGYAKDAHRKEILSYNDAIGAIRSSSELNTPVELTGDVPGDIGWYLSNQGINT